MESDIPSNGCGPDVATAVSLPTEAGPEPVDAGSRSAGPALFRERFEQLLPTIRREWPQVAQHTLEATRGSFDTVVEVIARQTGSTSFLVLKISRLIVQFVSMPVHQLADSHKYF